jgi:hypothetical protein
MGLSKDKVLLSIEPGLLQRLDFQAARDGKGHDRSSIVEGLIKSHLVLPDDLAALLLVSNTPGLGDVKAAGCQSCEAVERSKATLHLSVDASRRLGFYAVWVDRNRGAVVEDLIREHVTPWKIYDPRECHLTSRRKDRRNDEAQISPDVAGSPGE